MRHKVPPSLDYFKVLRKGAATACERLLKAEWADQDNDKNILVRKNDPTEESISKFMSKIFYGDIDIPGKVEGADKLKKAYTEYIRVTKGKKDKVKQDAYLLLCVAASTDVRSFTR